MIYLFEDTETSSISRLLTATNFTGINFRFSGGAGSLPLDALECLKDSQMVIVYLDAVPNNRNILSSFEELNKVSRENQYRIVVFPIVCAEYYYLRSLYYQPVWKDDPGMLEAKNAAIGMKPYTHLEFLKEFPHKNYATFERFCKLVCAKCLSPCAYIKLRGSAKSRYAEIDCNSSSCSYKKDACKPLNLSSKSLLLQLLYPVFPLTVDRPTVDRLPCISVRSCTLQDLWQIHHDLVDDFNAWTDRFKQADISGKPGFYEHLYYIH